MEYTAAASCVLDFPIGKGGKSKIRQSCSTRPSMIDDPAEYERPCEYLCLYCLSHDAFRKQVKAYVSSFYFEFITFLILSRCYQL